MIKHLVVLSSLAVMSNCRDVTSRRFHQMQTCLADYELNALDFIDINRLAQLLGLENKLACVVTCAFRIDNKSGLTLYKFLEIAVNLDTGNIESEVKKCMQQKLDECHTSVKENDCMLLQCLNILKHPFLEILYQTNILRELNS